MTYRKAQLGFSAVELLITLFVVSAFLMTGYQLYSVIIKDGGNARTQARAVNVMDDYMNRSKLSIPTNPPQCVDSPLSTQSIPADTGLSNATLTVDVSCPYQADSPNVSKITVKLLYGNNPQKELNNATFVSP